MDFKKHAFPAKKLTSTVIGYAPPGSPLPYLLQQNKSGTGWTCDLVQCRVPSAAHTQDVSYARFNLSVSQGPLQEQVVCSCICLPHWPQTNIYL